MNLRFSKRLIGLVFTLLSTSVLAETLSIEQGYIRETIPGTKVSSAYFKIINSGSEEKTIVGAKSAVSPRLELHQHLMEDGMMKMRQVEKIVVPAKGEVLLQPSGLHVMIFELDEGLKAGSKHSITLVMKDGSEFNTELPVQRLGKKPKTSEHHHHHH